MARVSLTGDFDKVDHWRRLFEKGHIAVKVTSKLQAEQMLGLVREGFRTERDPYGRRWKPKKRPDGRKVLHGKTGQLEAGWHVQKADAGGSIIAPSVRYAAPHQRPRRGPDGRLKRPTRMMVPTPERGVPARWKDRMKRAADTALRGYYGGKQSGFKLPGLPNWWLSFVKRIASKAFTIAGV